MATPKAEATSMLQTAEPCIPCGRGCIEYCFLAQLMSYAAVEGLDNIPPELENIWCGNLENIQRLMLVISGRIGSAGV